MRVWLCEKPSQGKDVAQALGVIQKNQGFIETNDGIVTWAIGHLFEEAPPAAYGEQYKSWNIANLPIIPDEWQMVLKDKVRDQFSVIRNVLKKATDVVIATDPDAEGERIARNILLECKYKGPIQRLWTGSMLEESLRKAFKQLKPGKDTEGYYQASLARSRGDWLVGMNMTRYITLVAQSRTRKIQGQPNTVMRCGRVKTPTLWLVVKREEDIENFIPRDYFELNGILQQENMPVDKNGNPWAVTLSYAPKDEEDRIYDQNKAQMLASECAGVTAPLRVKTEAKKGSPPKPFSLFDLQRFANSAWNWTADYTLSIAQALYETHKATTYPRTDCGFLPEEAIEEVPRILGFLKYMEEFEPTIDVVYQKNGPHYRKSTFDSSKITAHHGIIPTLQKPDMSRMNDDEQKAYLAIARRYIATLSPDFEYTRTSITLEPKEGVVFSAAGNVPTYLGWKEHFTHSDREVSEEDEEHEFPPLTNGVPANLDPIDVQKKTTKPPAYYTESTLLADMKGIKKFVDDPELKKILNDEEGIGTEATRATIIKELKEAYLRVEGKKYLRPTATGTELIGIVRTEVPRLCDPGETALWEKQTAIMREKGTSSIVLINQIAAQISASINQGKERNPNLINVGGGGTGQPTGLSTDKGIPILDAGNTFLIEGMPKIWKTVANATLSVQDAADLANKGRTKLIQFQGPKGPFSAVLVLRGEKYEFEFDEEESTPTGVTTTAGKPILETSKGYSIPGVLRLSKTICAVSFTPQQAATLVDSGKIGPFTFRKKDGTGTFVAFLVLQEGKANFEFDNGQYSEKTETLTDCPLSGKKIVESDANFFSPQYPGIPIPKIFKEKKLHPEDVARILASRKEGVEMELISKGGKPFKTKVWFNPEQGKYKPGLQMIMEDWGSSGGGGGGNNRPPAKKAAKKSAKPR
jgi:DNA topoisomerase III